MTQTIALVDDDRNILTSISMALEREGFRVQTYIDGESALIGLTRNPPDLAILDIKMPRMDGEELLRRPKHKLMLRICGPKDLTIASHHLLQKHILLL